MYKPVEIKVIENYKIWIKFSDGVEGDVDLSHLAGKGIFKSWQDYNFFKNVQIGKNGEIIWDDKIDICADNIYMELTNKKPDELFPKLKTDEVNA